VTAGARAAGRGLGRLLALSGALAAWPGGAGAQGFPPKPPRPTPLSPARYPPFQQTTLANGLELVIIEHHAQPVVSVTLSFRAGAIYDPPGKDGLATLVAELLTKGTEARSAEQIAASIEGAGGSLAAGADDDFLTISADALGDQLELVFDLLGDVTLHSRFAEGELALARTRALSALALELSEPAAVAHRLFAREIYGRNPYGKSATRESYQAITREDVTQFAAQRLRPRGALLVVAGDVTESQVRALVERAFGTWRGAPPPSPALPAPPTKPATDILLVHRPGSAQATIVLGNTTTGPGDPGYFAARIATQALGGGADSRLFMILRERKGWTYGAYASLTRYRGMGYWTATAAVRTEVTDSALGELLRQVERIRTETIPDSELTAVKGFLVGSFPLTVETPGQIATQVATAKLLGLGDDYLRLYRERLSAVTARQAEAAAARLYRRQALTIVVVGDAAVLYDRLKPLAPVRLVDLDGTALAPDALQPRAAPVALNKRVVVARRDSFSILANGNPVGTLVAVVAGGGDSLVYTEHTEIPLASVTQHTRVVLDTATLAVRAVEQTGVVRGMHLDVRLTYAGGRVRGHASTPQADGTLKALDIDTTLAPGTIDGEALNVLLPALPLEPGKTITLNVFTAGDATTRVLTLKVGAPESVTVPAGTFAAWRLDVTGGQTPLVIHVSTAAPRRTVKTEPVGTSLQFVLVH
jgi:zinc protease